MASKYKRVRKEFDYMHCDDFAAYLSEMAAKGWHFKIWEDRLVFEKGEPADVTYAVEVFDKAKERDLEPGWDAFEFSEYCEAAGWKFIDSRRKFYVLKKIREDAVPLFDSEERVKNAWKASFHIAEIIAVVLCIGFMAFVVNSFASFAGFTNFIFAYEKVFRGMFFCIALFGLFYSYGERIWIRIRLGADKKNGREIYLGNHRKGAFHIYMLQVLLLVAIVIFLMDLCLLGHVKIVAFALVAAVAIILFCIFLRRVFPKRRESKEMLIVYWVAIFLGFMVMGMNNSESVDSRKNAAQEMPFLVTHYREYPHASKYKLSDISRTRSIFGKSTEYTAWYTIDEKTDQRIRYNAYESRCDWVLNKIWRNAKKEAMSDGITYCTEDWQAEEAFRNGGGDYYVKYNNMIFVLHELPDVYLTKEQIDIIRHKMDFK
ncbi:MAG: DUF2812 domain-containing protein [Lachnospiraceae bacterium]|nr:DUF2812 domain-containing protein [Lachnospiraceae bacterium]